MKKKYIMPETLVQNVQPVTIIAESLIGGGQGQNGDTAQSRMDWDVWEEETND